MGVFPDFYLSVLATSCLPHARGGVSLLLPCSTPKKLSSPRTWGCFHGFPGGHAVQLVFPTHVGVFLHELKIYGDGLRLPHARGGVSKRRARPVARKTSSPRTWGCFLLSFFTFFLWMVFPTHVGVFPKISLAFFKSARLPHARGGVSIVGAKGKKWEESSPRTWGCFTLGAGLSGFGIVFPTHVGGRQAEVAPRKPLPHGWGFSRLPLT